MTTPEIVTFYSYKGGTGRSMALANVAWILAANGKRVLVIDWDLEAPGLHRYFHPFLTDEELVRSDGLIDFILEYAEQAVSPGDRAKDWYKPYANLLYYAASLKYEFPNKGTVDFVPAGRQGVDYATRVNAFNWQHFYERLDGGLLLEAAKLSMAGYDFVLIDSRTGVSDTSGICTVQMPNTLVICFTLNKQSIEGAVAVAESADAQRVNDSGEHTLRILPVPTRVEPKEEQGRLNSAMAVAREKFDRFLWHMPGSINDYWSQVSVQYQPFYAFEEILAVFGDTAMRPQSMLASMEALAGWIATPGAPLPLPEIPTIERQATLARYLRQESIRSPYLTSRLTDHGVAVKALNVLADKGLLVSGDSNGRLFQWDLATLRLQTRSDPLAPGLRAISTFGDELLIASSTNGLIEVANGREAGPIVTSAVRSISGNAAGSAVYGTDTGEVNLIETNTSRVLGKHNGPVTALWISRDGRYAVSGSYDRIAIRWDIPANTAVMTYSAHTEEITALVLDSTEKWLLTGSADKTLRLWEVATGRHIRTYEGHTDKIQSVALSPDGRLAASASTDRSVRIWEVNTGVCLLHLTGHTDVVNAAVFTPEGRRVVSASDDGSLIEWDVREMASLAMSFVQVSPTSKESASPTAVPQGVAEQQIPYLAYLSYSRDDRDSYFGKFARDLDKELSRVSNSRGRTVWYNIDDSRGFFDVWADNPLKSAKVAICLLSPGYLASEQCGRELSLFLQRSHGGLGMLPIIWRPVQEVPGPLARLQTRLGIPAYDEQGLAYIMRLSRYRDDYKETVQRLATALLRIATESPLEETPNLPSPEAFTNAFSGVASAIAEVTCVVRSLASFGRSLEEIVLEAAKDAGVPGVDFANFASDLLVRTAQKKTTLIVIMDAENPDLIDFAKRLEWQAHCALLVLNRVPRRRPPSGIGYYEQNITTAARLRDAVVNAVVKIRTENIRQTVLEDSEPVPGDPGDALPSEGPDEEPSGPHGSIPSPA